MDAYELKSRGNYGLTDWENVIFEIIKCRKKQCEIVNEISWLLVFPPKKEEGRDERNKVEKEELGSLQNVGS